MVARNASTRKRPGIKNAAEIDVAAGLKRLRGRLSHLIRRT
jgi:hypothetical protein